MIRRHRTFALETHVVEIAAAMKEFLGQWCGESMSRDSHHEVSVHLFTGVNSGDEYVNC
jgi:hypothetical protein